MHSSLPRATSFLRQHIHNHLGRPPGLARSPLPPSNQHNFSSSPFLLTKAARPSKPSAPDPCHPKFSLRDLGANRAAKATVLVCLAVLGTMETVFWAKVLWAQMGMGLAEGRGDLDERGE